MTKQICKPANPTLKRQPTESGKEPRHGTFCYLRMTKQPLNRTQNTDKSTAEDGLLPCKKPCFAMQKATFYIYNQRRLARVPPQPTDYQRATQNGEKRLFFSQKPVCCTPTAFSGRQIRRYVR